MIRRVELVSIVAAIEIFPVELYNIDPNNFPYQRKLFCTSLSGVNSEWHGVSMDAQFCIRDFDNPCRNGGARLVPLLVKMYF
jgi:hypothetical protein